MYLSVNTACSCKLHQLMKSLVSIFIHSASTFCEINKVHLILHFQINVNDLDFKSFAPSIIISNNYTVFHSGVSLAFGLVILGGTVQKV